MSQILQLNGELPDRFPDHQRRLHILICRRKSCHRKGGSVRALRAVRSCSPRPAEPRQSQASSATTDFKANTIGNEIFGIGSFPSLQDMGNPFSKIGKGEKFPPDVGLLAHDSFIGGQNTKLFSSANDKISRFSSKAQKPLIIPPTPNSEVDWPSPAPNPLLFPRYYLDAEYENLDDHPEQSKTQGVTIETDKKKHRNLDPLEDGVDVFESTLDKAFQQFADRLAQNPLQVLRYEFGGSPLLYCNTDEVGKMLTNSRGSESFDNRIPPCPNCQKGRVFELQVTPQAISELEIDESGLDGMEWGTVILAVCRNDCLPAGIDRGKTGYLEEWVGVQWEEKAR